MIPNYNNRQVESGGITESAVFAISAKDETHIMGILRDTLYSKKILAVLREYSSNAWDAHRDAGKADVPIRVVLPTLMDPTLTIQDFGKGLSHEDAFQVYTQYGASTKRNSDNTVGMLGIGSKSGFCYSDSFTVTSCHGGMRRTYIAVLDASENGQLNLLYSEECGNETGVTIKIPVDTNDIDEFESEAASIFQYFIPRPDINIELPEHPTSQLALKHGLLDEKERSYGDWTAVMGCVPYRINLEQLQNVSGGIGGYANKLSGVLFFGIGEVQVSASREELKYSSSTKIALKNKFDIFIEEYVQHSIKIIEDNTQTMWDRRTRLQILNRLHLPIPERYKDLVLAKIEFNKDDNKDFLITVGSGMVHAEEIKVHESTRFIIKDTIYPLTEYSSINYHDYLIRPTTLTGLAVAELEVFIQKHSITGIPTIFLGSLTRTPPLPKKTKKKEPKYYIKNFVLNPGTKFGYPWSDAWSVEKRTPTDSDVFVILESFQTEEYNFYSYYKIAHNLADAFKITLPKIYGYKSTKKFPIKPENCKGTEFLKWYREFPKTLLIIKPEIITWLSAYEWNQISKTSYDYKNVKSLERVRKYLGDKHPITEMLIQQENSDKILNILAGDIKYQLSVLSDMLYKGQNLSEAGIALKNIYDQYPLLTATGEKLEVLWEAHSKAWADYIKLVDKNYSINKGEENEQSTAVHND
jgi:hypothetical protein